MQEDLRKVVRLSDLALAACRKRQNSRTGFVHFFPGEEMAQDTIPIYENFCFVVALFRQKNAEAIIEGKELLFRLLAFQGIEGGFPVYIHEYPACKDPLMPLRLVPLLRCLCDQFGSLLGSDLKKRCETALSSLLVAATKRREEKPYPALWEERFAACTGMPLPEMKRSFSPLEWGERLITHQLRASVSTLSIPFNPVLQAFIGSVEQEKGEPRPFPIEWALIQGEFSKRLLADHPHQIHAAALFPCTVATLSPPWSFSEKSFQFLWQGKTLHSLYGAASQADGDIKQTEQGFTLIFDLDGLMPEVRSDLFEVSLFVDISSETEIWIEGEKASVFALGETIHIKTPQRRLKLSFNQVEGEGQFCGHVFRANRPGQKACKGDLLYEVFDWQIALRTLRRSGPCRIEVLILID